MNEFITLFGEIRVGLVIAIAIAIYWIYKGAKKVYTDVISMYEERKRHIDILEDMQKYKKQQNLMAEGLMGLMRYRLVRECQKAIEKKEITDERLEIIDDLYIPYKELGGNGVAKKYVKEAQTLPIKK
jgi:hypothetical protein